MLTKKSPTDVLLEQVKTTMMESLRDTNIAQLLPANRNLLGSGKMLRARLALTIGTPTVLRKKPRSIPPQPSKSSMAPACCTTM